jgi:hypothetical protein
MKSLTRLATLVLVFSICTTLTFPQEKPSKKDKKSTPVQTAAPVSPAPVRPPLEFGLSEDTPVRIKLTRTMSSKDAKAGEKVDFEVLEDIKVRDVVVIQHGAMAIGTVTEAQPKRRMGRAGKLNINIDYVQLVDGEKVPLRAVKGGSGGNHTGAMTGAIVASSILFFPAAPFFLFMHGKDITIPKGTEVSAYVAADTPLDPAKFNNQSSAVESGTSKPDASATAMSAVVIKSTPDGAEITIDGKLVGTTPSTVQLTPGEHTISIDKSGFKQWQRTITVTAGGAINLEATLDKLP